MGVNVSLRPLINRGCDRAVDLLSPLSTGLVKLPEVAQTIFSRGTGQNRLQISQG